MENIIHYTDATAFLSILKNQELWASDAKYLNDYDEINHGKHIFIEEFKLLGDNGSEGSVSDITTIIIEFLSWQSVRHYFLAHEASCVTPHKTRRNSKVTSFRLWAHSCTARYC
jgi:hypothetical protein